jgi:antitoxin CptB
MTNQQSLILKQKLIYRSIHRGCKETDFLIGEFAKENLNQMTDDELLIYQDFLEQDDLEIYNWVIDKTAIQAKYLPLITAIKKFHKIT